MATRRRNEQSPEPQNDLGDDLADLTPSGFKYPFVAPSPGTFETMTGSRKSRKRQLEAIEILGEEMEKQERERQEREREQRERAREREEREEKLIQTTKHEIEYEQRQIKSWEAMCSITKKAVTVTVGIVLFYIVVALLTSRLGWVLMDKYIA